MRRLEKLVRNEKLKERQGGEATIGFKSRDLGSYKDQRGELKGPRSGTLKGVGRTSRE